MLIWSIIFLITGIIAGLYGFGGDGKFTSQAAKCCSFIFTTLFILSLIYSFLPEPLTLSGSKKNEYTLQKDTALKNLSKPLPKSF
ncbi:MAG: DUF1328 domain-containing protein [Chlamydiia bacterium]